ncbi:MAG: endonuclease/exonuclease/phosphatase family protein [Alphaproteobacteria bacterium]
MSVPTRRAAAMAAIRRRLVQAAAVFAVLSVLSHLGGQHWILELLSHFRVQFAAVAVMLALFTLATRQWRIAALFGVLAAAHAAPLAGYLVDFAGTEAHAAGPGAKTLPLTVSYHNLRHRAADHDGLFAHLKRAKPDVLVLTEMDYERRADLFHGLRRQFPHFGATPGPSIFNVAVFSRFPLTEVERMLDTSNNWPMLHVRVCPEKERRCLRILALHAHPPFGRWTEVRNTAMQEAAMQAAGGEHDSVIVVGDFNCTPWSPDFHEMLKLGALRDENRAGLASTWGGRSPLLGLQIDHILVGPGVEEGARRIGPSFGSDHFLLTAELEFAAPRLAPSASAP